MDSIITVFDICNREDFNGAVMCAQAAAAYWSLSTYCWQDFPIFFYKSAYHIEYVSGPLRFLGVPDGVPTTHLEPLMGGLLVTDKWQTICDLARYDCDLFHSQEAIANFYCYEDADSVNRLEEMAASYGLCDKLHQLRDQGFADFENQ